MIVYRCRAKSVGSVAFTDARLGHGDPRSGRSTDTFREYHVSLRGAVPPYTELRETRTWLKFVREMKLASPELVDPALHECDELLAILATSIKTARRNGRRTNDH